MQKTTGDRPGRTRRKIIPSVAVRRRVIAVIVTAEFALVAALAVRALAFHHKAPLAACAVLALGIVSGLNYLNSTRGRR